MYIIVMTILNIAIWVLASLMSSVSEYTLFESFMIFAVSLLVGFNIRAVMDND